MSFLSELKRRRVFHAVAIYVVIALGVLQAADLILDGLQAPAWLMRGLVILGLAGLPVATVLGWLFEIRRDHTEPQGDTRARTPRRWRQAQFVAALTACVAFAGMLFWVGFRGLSPAVADRSIAVLPFDNVGGDPRNLYFSDGFTEDVRNGLAKIDGLRVISRSSTMQYRGSDRPRLPEMAKALGVGHILEGSVQRAGDQLRIRVQLVRASDDAHIWSDQFDRPIHDIFAVQSEIARAVAQRMQATLTRSERRRVGAVPTHDLEAYALFMRGREAYYYYLDPAKVDEAIHFFERATQRDPQFALAHAYLARSLSLRSRHAGPALLDSAAALARRSIELAPDEPDSYSALGEVLREAGRFEDALAQYERALDLEPNHAPTLVEVGETHSRSGLGNLDESVRWTLRAIRINPAEPWYYGQISHSYVCMDDLESAARWADSSEAVVPGNTWALAMRARIAGMRGDTAAFGQELAELLERDAERGRSTEADIRLAIGDRPGAIRAAEAWFAEHPDATVAPPAIVYAIALTDRARALDLLGDVEDLAKEAVARGNQAPWPRMRLAHTAMIRGDRAAALAHLEDWLAHGGRGSYSLRTPTFDALRDERRFQAIATELDRIARAQRASLARQGL